MNWGILHVYRLFIHVWHSLQQSLGKAGVESVLQIFPRQRHPLATREHSRPVGDEWIHGFGMSAVQEHVLQLEAVVPEDVLDGHMMAHGYNQEACLSSWIFQCCDKVVV